MLGARKFSLLEKEIKTATSSKGDIEYSVLKNILVNYRAPLFSNTDDFISRKDVAQILRIANNISTKHTCLKLRNGEHRCNGYAQGSCHKPRLVEVNKIWDFILLFKGTHIELKKDKQSVF